MTETLYCFNIVEEAGLNVSQQADERGWGLKVANKLHVTWSSANINDNVWIKRANNDSMNNVTQIRVVRYTFTQIHKVTIRAVQ